MAKSKAGLFDPEVAHESEGWQRHEQRDDFEGALAYLIAVSGS
jgi:hypothetical protein